MMNFQSLTKTRKPPFLMLSTPSLTDRTVTISTFKYAQCSFGTSLNPLTALFKRPKNPSLKAIKSLLKEDRVLESKDAALLVSTCIRRTLPPALTLEQGLDKIQEAVEELKANPPCSSKGMITFEVAVPPSAKALNWFLSQQDKAGVFPLFFLSKEDNPSYKTLALGKTRGVFGIGAAIYFKGYYSHAPMSYTQIKRYASTESTFPLVYGFLDVNYDTVSSTLKHQAGSFYFFIPQIELHEFEEVTILVATLAWNNSSICSFEEAIEAYKFSLYKVSNRVSVISSLTENNGNPSSFGFRNSNITDEKILEMVCMYAIQLGGCILQSGNLELKGGSCCSSQYSALISPSIAISSNMDQSEFFDKTSYSVLDCQNINSLWASLIIEECTRLGLTYICVAPGSRSSPLAIAASAHPLTTCIACIDERSLAFHGVGYARGSHKPAVIITSSGTAASNLLPAVVEASQDFVPMLLLTADRPPELQDVGANQAIDQVNHFGSFVRQYFELPVPTDEIFARMVLTTLDSAVNLATSSPSGPVHINCPFREPLVNIPKMWDLSCLKGLDVWLSTAEPFTTYIPIKHSIVLNQTDCRMDGIIKVIQGAKRGLLILGSIHTEDDIWAALLLSKHLLWPVVVDILSGLRMRKHIASFIDMEENILFLDHLDYLLLSDRVRDWMQPDVVIQLGSRITSVRISQMIEHSLPLYIMVDGHPRRHDPLHIVTHRIQSKITEFTDCVMKTCTPCLSSQWKSYLQALEMMAAWETSFIIRSEYSLTEPYVAHVIPETLFHESAVFLGNSMPIRDADMYAFNAAHNIHNASKMSRYRLPCHWVQVAGNRGASGIDGLLSTAVGFAVGCKKRVLCVIGDISFLHDTNGLALLGQEILRKPGIILVINNHGGGIFSLLPIANMTERKVLDRFFYTTHNTSISNLCLAHRVKHVQVSTKMELLDALFTSQQEQVDCVIEVESCIDANAIFHRKLKSFGYLAGDHTFNVLSKLSVSETSQGLIISRIAKMEYKLYRIKLCAPPTSTSVSYGSEMFYREGFVLSLSLEDGSTGYGEVAPLEIHEENLLDVSEQLEFLIHAVEGAKIDYILPLLKGSFSSWIWNTLGIPPSTIFPSVRCGLEMAVLSTIAARENSTLLKILYPKVEESPTKLLGVPICALIDSGRSPNDIANVATSLVEEGFTAIKIKVARGTSPIDDVAVIQEVRRKVGYQVALRVDANKNWTIDEAIKFAKLVKDYDLQYIEEPVKDEEDIIKFCDETGLPVALDETINCIRENPSEVLEKYAHTGIVAVVIKPSLIGGFENAALVAQWAQQRGKMAVVSATFESSLGLSGYIQFSSFLDLQYSDICRVMNEEPSVFVAHGLGTYKWLEEDVTLGHLKVQRNTRSGFVEACPMAASQLMQQFDINQNVVVWKFNEEKVHKVQLSVDLDDFSFSINVLSMGPNTSDNLVVFLHGFLGTSGDWIPIMKALSRSTRCIAIDLPGHGESTLQYQSAENYNLSMDVICRMLCKLFPQIIPGKVILVGYSMGARISLHMALKCCDKVQGAVIISGSPGLVDPSARTLRRAKDDSRASFLVSYGLEFFLDSWYAEDIWNSLRNHPHYKTVFANRLQHHDLYNLAKVLSDLSIGRQQPLWEDLKECKVPLHLIVGEHDPKFKKIAREMLHKLKEGSMTEPDIHKIKEIPNSGHAVHLENPLPVITAIGNFLRRTKSAFLFSNEEEEDSETLVVPTLNSTIESS